MGSRCVCSVIIHDNLISVSHCHAVSLVAFSENKEQSF